MITLDLSILNQKGTPMFYSDTLANRPNFGIEGRIFIDTASPYGIYRDTGSSWQQIAVGSAGTGTITGGGTINTIAMFTPTGTAIGDSKITQSVSDITIDANTYITNGNLWLAPNNTAGGTNYAIKQVMATNDAWGIYGNTIAIDKSEVVFEVSDNGATFDPAGQRWRFHYEATSSGSNKDPLIIDYNKSFFTTTIESVNTLTGITGTSPTDLTNSFFANSFTYNSGISTSASVNTIGLNVDNNLNYSGANTINVTSYNTSELLRNILTFGSAGASITYSQATGIRSLVNSQLQYFQSGTNNGTISHYANLQVLGDNKTSSGLTTFTNRYQILLNDYDEFGAGNTYTNRWAIYQDGLTNQNYFAGNTKIGSSTTLLYDSKLQLTGDAYFTGVFRETITKHRDNASSSLILAYNGKLIEMNVATANTLTIPLAATSNLPVGSKIDVTQYGAGQTQIVAAVGVTLLSAAGATKLRVQYSGATLIQADLNVWYLFGDITT